MPGIDGIEFYSRVRELCPRLASQIIFITGGALTRAGKAFLSTNAPTTLEKPFDPSELTALVTNAVAKASD